MYNVGDIVQLISGGPVMTVVSVSQMAGVECFWFWHHALEVQSDRVAAVGLVVHSEWQPQLFRDHFPEEALLLVKAKQTEVKT